MYFLSQTPTEFFKTLHFKCLTKEIPWKFPDLRSVLDHDQDLYKLQKSAKCRNLQIYCSICSILQIAVYTCKLQISANLQYTTEIIDGRGGTLCVLARSTLVVSVSGCIYLLRKGLSRLRPRRYLLQNLPYANFARSEPEGRATSWYLLYRCDTYAAPKNISWYLGDS